MEHQYTVEQLIADLQRLSDEKKQLPIIIACPNGEVTRPHIRLWYDDPFDIWKQPPNKIFLSYQ